ncbi:MAG: preprotein translocase subunit SecG [Gammaproteobacteria bacterium]|nr:preprotein translocase subunit SecG [Gammaproteobacteria bacterium]
MLYSILVSVDVLIAAGLIGLVLLQRGAGAAAGAAFGGGGGGGGGGASGTVFGAKGSSSFMSRATAILAAAFFVNSIVLAYLASNRDVTESVMESVTQEQQIDIPQTPSDLPNVIDLPEDATGEEMLDIIKEEIEKKADQASDIPEAAGEALDDTIDKAEQAIPSDIPQ